MKKIFFILVILFFYIQSYADSSIKLGTSAESIKVGETFQVSFTIESTGSVALSSVKVKGAEVFNNLGTSQSQNFVMLNGDVKTSYTYTMTLEGIIPGEYVLGPAEVEIDTLKLVSNTLNIKVGEGNNIISENSSEELHDVENSFFQKIKLLKFYIFLLLLLFFALFFFLLKFFFSKKEPIMQEKNDEEGDKLTIKDYIKNELVTLEKNIDKYSDNEYLEKIIFLLRMYIGDIFSIEMPSTRTLSELSNTIKNTEVSNLFSKLYVLEYSRKESLEKQEKMKYIHDFLRLL